MDDGRTLTARLLGRVFVPLSTDDVVLCLRTIGTQAPLIESIDGLLIAEFERFREGDSQGQWICPALSGKNGLAEDEFITLSSWPLRSRIVFDVLSEAQELMLMRQFCDISISALEAGRSDSDLGPMVERIEGLTVHFDKERSLQYRASEGLYSKLTTCREAAEDAYPVAMRREKSARDDAAAVISRLSGEEILFGVQTI